MLNFFVYQISVISIDNKDLVDKKNTEFNSKNVQTLANLKIKKKKTICKKFAFHPTLTIDSKKIFKESNITLAVKNSHNIKILIKAKLQRKITKQSRIYTMNCQNFNMVYNRQKETLTLD